MFDASGMYPNRFDRTGDFNATATTYIGTQRPPMYYFIDFGLSRQHPSRDVMDEPLRGGDRSAPEHGSQRRCNPFQTDVYYIGNLVRQEFIEVRPAVRGIR